MRFVPQNLVLSWFTYFFHKTCHNLPFFSCEITRFFHKKFAVQNPISAIFLTFSMSGTTQCNVQVQVQSDSIAIFHRKKFDIKCSWEPFFVKSIRADGMTKHFFYQQIIHSIHLTVCGSKASCRTVTVTLAMSQYHVNIVTVLVLVGSGG